MTRRFPPLPTSISSRDSRYSGYLEEVTESLEKEFRDGELFTIVDATEKLAVLQRLRPTTRHDVAGAVMRTLVAMEILDREGMKFVFPCRKNKSKKRVKEDLIKKSKSRSALALKRRRSR